MNVRMIFIHTILWGNLLFSAVAAEDLKFITLDVAPWASYDKSTSQYIGVFPALVREIESRTGYLIEISLSVQGFSRISRELELGRHDCTMLIEQKDIKEHVVRGEHIFDHPMGVVAHKKNAIASHKDLYGLRISVNEVLTEKGQFMDDAGLLTEFDDTYEKGLNKIEHGRLDAVAGAIPTIMFLAKKLSFDGILGEPLVLRQDPIYLQCSTKSNHQGYLREINEAIKNIKNDGTLEQIINCPYCIKKLF